jgi:hypothetical protein
MKTFLVTADVTISVHTVVKAPSRKAAIEIARERGMQSLCNQCAIGTALDEWTTSGELDGEPKNLDATEEKRV